ncbi:ricin B lectin domain-containing protein [Mycena albidolilacea]|uniref:Ricin B lectin domain-containing protein n=1 Tax=Mycena albidolilacea TaxID=1033008 RepID=A0AAD6ZPV9_9AGAR|nr:ricin B lectin domain-containing protein [Mycena albidolilacea]
MFLRNIVSLLCLRLHFPSCQCSATNPSVQIKTALASNKCLTAASNADGAAVTIETCTNITTLNSWVLPGRPGEIGTISIFGDKCLDVTNGANTDGTKLQIWTCALGNTNQMWLPAGQDNTIAWAVQNKCVDLTNRNLADGNQVQIWDCDAQNSNQKWNSVAALPTTVLSKAHLSFSLMLEKDRSLCVAVNSPQAGSPLVIEKCSPNSVFQTFNRPTPLDKIILFGLCIAPVDQIATPSGAKLVLAECEDSNAEKWNIFPGNALGVLTHFQLQLWDCSATAPTGAFENTNQEWIVTNYIPPRI